MPQPQQPLRPTPPAQAAAPATSAAPAYEPPPPRNLDETGLGIGFLSDLVLKVMYFEGYISGATIADRIKLPFSGVVDQVLEFLKREQFCEVRSAAGGFGEQSYQYAISNKGREKAREALDRSQYAGPAPVPLVSGFPNRCQGYLCRV